MLRELHWLPDDQPFVYKILFFSYKGLHHLAPHYIQYLLTISYQKRNPFDRPRQIYMLLSSPI